MKTIEMNEQNAEKLRWCTFKITCISAAYYPLQLNLVQNIMLRNGILS